VVLTPAEEAHRRGRVTLPIEVDLDRSRRLANQRLFPRYYVECACEAGCHVCAYTGLVTKCHAKHAPPASGEETNSSRGDS
jgi:hypothetical protein